MLVVTRKQDESIVIGNEIEVMVLRIDRNSVRIGVRAPRHISIHRKEIFEEIKRENIAASASQVVEIARLQELLGAAAAAPQERDAPESAASAAPEEPRKKAKPDPQG